MNPNADYPPPVKGFNPITEMNLIITETNRVICYNQTIYDDDRPEDDEYFSLILIVQSESAIPTQVDSKLNTALVKIINDDGELTGVCGQSCKYFTPYMVTNLLLVLGVACLHTK